jgi:transcriptional regulator with XRE-family HTH domain
MAKWSKNGMDITELLLIIGKRIKKERERQSLTQGMLASMLDSPISKSNISKLERGKGNPTLQKLLLVANALGIELWDLIIPEGIIVDNDQGNYPPALQKLINNPSVNITDREKKLLLGIKINGQVPDNIEIYKFFLGLFRNIDWNGLKETFNSLSKLERDIIQETKKMNGGIEELDDRSFP